MKSSILSSTTSGHDEHHHDDDSDLVMVKEDSNPIVNLNVAASNEPLSRSLPTNYAELFLSSFRHSKKGATANNTEPTALLPVEMPSAPPSSSNVEQDDEEDKGLMEDDDSDIPPPLLDTNGNLILDDDVHGNDFLSPDDDDEDEDLDDVEALTAPVREIDVVISNLTHNNTPNNGALVEDNDHSVANSTFASGQQTIIPSPESQRTGVLVSGEEASVLSLQIDDVAVSTMSERLLATMDNTSPNQDAFIMEAVEAENEHEPTGELKDSALPEHPQNTTPNEEIKEPSGDENEVMGGSLGFDAFMTVGEQMMIAQSSKSPADVSMDNQGNDGELFDLTRKFWMAMFFVLVVLPSIVTICLSRYAILEKGVVYVDECPLSNNDVSTTGVSSQIDKVLGLNSEVSPLDDSNSSTFFGFMTSIFSLSEDEAVEGANNTVSEDLLFATEIDVANSTQTVSRLLGFFTISSDVVVSDEAMDGEADSDCLLGFCTSSQTATDSSISAPGSVALPRVCQCLLGGIVALLVGIISCTYSNKAKDLASIEGGPAAVKCKIEKWVQQNEDSPLKHLDLSNYELLRKVDLQNVLKRRDCRVGGNKSDLIARLVQDYREELEQLPYKKLQSRLKRQQLKQSGKREELIARLLEAGL